MGGGSLFAAFYLARRASVTRLLPMIGVLMFVVFLGLIAFSPFLSLTCGLLIIMGFASLLFNASNNTLLQMATPDALRGRVMSILFLLMAGSTPIGGFLTGWLTDIYGIRRTLGIEAAICALGAIWGISYFVKKKLYLEEAMDRTRVRG